MEELRAAPSVDPAAWVIDGTEGFAENVGSLVPHGFEGYARILHPTWSAEPENRRVLWSEIAESNGRVAHPEAQWPHIAFVEEVTDINQLQNAPVGALWHTAPEEGTLERDDAPFLIEVLRSHTTTPDRCWFGAWEGWSGMLPQIYSAPAFKLPSRGFYLLEGSIDGVTETVYPAEFGYQSASLWWPDDHSWCVATDVDLESTYLGGSRDCIEAVLSTPGLEVLEAQVTDGVTWASDTVNPNPLRLALS